MAAVLAAVFIALAVLAAAPAFAQPKDAKADALRRLQQQNQRLAGERAQLERERDEARRQAEATGRERDDLKRRAGSAAASAAKAKRELEEQRAAAEAERTKLAAQIAAASEREAGLRRQATALGEQLASAQAEGVALKRRLGNQQQTSELFEKRLGTCAEHNAALVTLGRELADQFVARGWVDTEPFTQHRRVRIETLGREYRDRVEGCRYDPRAETAKPGARP